MSKKSKIKKLKKKLKKQKTKIINTSALMYMYRDAYEELFDRTSRKSRKSRKWDY